MHGKYFDDVLAHEEQSSSFPSAGKAPPQFAQSLEEGREYKHVTSYH